MPPYLVWLQNDLREKHNIAVDSPEVSKNLKGTLDSWVKEMIEPYFEGLAFTKEGEPRKR